MEQWTWRALAWVGALVAGIVALVVLGIMALTWLLRHLEEVA